MKEDKVEGTNIYVLDNPILKKLIKESYFTPTQLTILLDYLYRKEYKLPITTKDKKVIINRKIIKRGSYYRILDQAKNKIYKTLITIILITSLGIIPHHDITSLLNKISTINLDVENLDLFEAIIEILKTFP